MVPHHYASCCTGTQPIYACLRFPTQCNAVTPFLSREGAGPRDYVRTLYVWASLIH